MYMHVESMLDDATMLPYRPKVLSLKVRAVI